jgi:hypothetical protein
MKLSKLLSQVDLSFLPYIPAIKYAQSVYVRAYGRYFQGLDTHTDIPGDGKAVTPDNAASRPADQKEKWLDLGQLPPVMLCSMKIDRYETAEKEDKKQGYLVTLTVRYEGQVYSKVIDFSDLFDRPWVNVSKPT